MDLEAAHSIAGGSDLRIGDAVAESLAKIEASCKSLAELAATVASVAADNAELRAAVAALERLLEVTRHENLVLRDKLAALAHGQPADNVVPPKETA